MAEPLGGFWYDLNHYAAFTVYFLAWSIRFEGARHVPRKGPVLLVANHQSYLDPVGIALAASHRRIHFLARKSLFRKPLFGAFLRSVNTSPIDQEGVAKEGIRTVIRLLEAGKPVLMFPEGERTRDGKMLPLKPGVHLLVKRAPVPIVPVGIAGAFEAFPRTAKLPRFCPPFLPGSRGAIAVSFGRPLDPHQLLQLPREQFLSVMSDAIQASQQRAERLRRKA